MTMAERDGSVSHGLFRLPGHVASLRSGKVNGSARPVEQRLTPAAIRLDGDRGFAPLTLEHGVPLVAAAARELGVAVLAIRNSFHFAALWPEVEAIAAEGLVGLACTVHTPMVAPFGAREAFFSTNPLAFAWPRPGREPYVFDLATGAMARGEIGVAARDGHPVPPGVGLDAQGDPTTDAAAIHDGGVILPFGGHKGSAIATMIELLAAGLVGDWFSYEAVEVDNRDGGPAIGGEFVLALSPEVLAGPGWAEHSEGFLARLGALDGVRLPGERRFANRRDTGPRAIDADLVTTLRGLC
jgi:delta1-piperideine-2-carboxylate reductase